jgi:mannose-6-phosphate isomerase-like protein (cupin superfamily)
MIKQFISVLPFLGAVVSFAGCSGDGRKAPVKDASGETPSLASPAARPSSDSTAKAFFLAPNEGRATGAGRLIFKLGSGESGSTFEFAEGTTDPREGPPEHIHLDMDEAFYVLSGVYRFKVGDQLQEAGPGWFIFVPKGVPHAFMNSGMNVAKHVEVHSRPELESYFREISEALKQMPPGPPDQKILNAISDKYRVRIVGPPLGNSVAPELPRNP